MSVDGHFCYAPPMTKNEHITLAEFAAEHGMQPYEMAAYLDLGTAYTDDMILSADLLAAGRASLAQDADRAHLPAVAISRSRGRLGEPLAQDADRAHLPALTGATGLLLDNAEGDRRSVLAQLDGEITKRAPGTALAAEMSALFREVALRQTDAGWWMSHVAARQIARDVVDLFTAEDRERHTAIRARGAMDAAGPVTGGALGDGDGPPAVDPAELEDYDMVSEETTPTTRVTVTLSPAIVDVTGDALTDLLDLLRAISAGPRPFAVSVWIDEGLKIKVDGRGWTRPIGTQR